MVQAIVHAPYYDWDGRKYLELDFDSKIVRVKVPYRYGRVMCRQEGIKTVQEFKSGDKVEVSIEKKTWDGIEHWILSYIRDGNPH